MAYTLNSAHALYGNLVELIGVQGGALVSHKTARTFTKHAEASYQSGGAYGEAFRTVGGGYTVKGASFSPAVSIDTVANPNGTLVVVVNQISSVGGGGKFGLIGTTTTSGGSYSLGMTTTGLVTSLENWTTLKSTGTVDLDTPVAPHMLAVVKIGETAHKVYVDGTFNIDVATRLAYNGTTTFWDYIGGSVGQGSVAQDVVWVAWFNKELTEAELDGLYASLGANNTFGLIESVAVAGEATSGTGTGTSTGSGGDAVGGGASATASGGTGTGVSSGTGGSATGQVVGTGSFNTDILINNAGTILAGAVISWTWWEGSIGSAPVSLTHGSGVTNGAGVLAVTGLPSSTGFLIARTADSLGVYYQPATVA